jgi:hypothetical protein
MKISFVVLRFIAVLMLVFGLADLAVIAHSVLLRKGSPLAIRIARKLMPFDAENDLVGADVDRVNADSYLRHATEENPWNSDAWIMMSINAEAKGDIAEAEAKLKEAAFHDSGRAPRWALANFYFRQGDTEHFFEWANRFRMLEGEPEPGLLRMAIELVPDSVQLVQRLSNLSCPEMGNIVELLQARQLKFEPVSQRMISDCQDKESRHQLSKVVSTFVSDNRPEDGLALWRAMGYDGLLSNASFKSPITDEGFDWHINQTPQIKCKETAAAGLLCDFTDRVEDGTVLLYQPVVLNARSRYRLSTLLHSEPDDDDSFHWELVELSTGRHLDAALDKDANLVENARVWKFNAPASSKSVALALYYQRAPGTPSFEGHLAIRGVNLVPQIEKTGTLMTQR